MKLNFLSRRNQLKELDEKFAEFENAAIQRESDYKQLIEQQRRDGEQLRGFEKLKESNLEMRSVSLEKLIIGLLWLNFRLLSFQKIQKLQENYQIFESPTKTPTKRSLLFGKENQSPIFARSAFEQSPKSVLKPRN